jgi:hypothetical protein
MEVHKPKAIHGWRDVLKEWGIIVLGVLTALAAEQTVEALHHRQVVAAGEAALRDNFSRFIEFKSEADQEALCMAARATELRTILDSGGKARRLGHVGTIPQPYPLPWQIDTWEAMVASGAAPYLPHAKTVLYSRIAMSGIDLYSAATGEWADWGALRSLSGPARPFSEAEEAKARDTLARAMEQADRVRFIADHTVDRIKGTRLLDQKAIDEAVGRGRHPDHQVAMCEPIAFDEP